MSVTDCISPKYILHWWICLLRYVKWFLWIKSWIEVNDRMQGSNPISLFLLYNKWRKIEQKLHCAVLMEMFISSRAYEDLPNTTQT